MTDRFSKFSPGLDGPCFSAVAVTPSDTIEISCRALYIGTGGTVSVQTLGYDGVSNTVSFTNVPNGSLLPIRVTKVLAETTASDIVALS